jgi:HD superfamily phosphodiesterase
MDESHGIIHSLNTMHFAKEIYDEEVTQYPFLREHENIIITSALLHDMCDKKYMVEDEGIAKIHDFLKSIEYKTTEIDIICKIMTTMSYSKVKSNGFPELGEYQNAYHIVREADLLAAIDFDRTIIYKLNQDSFEGAFRDAETLFYTRVFKHEADSLYTTNYAKRKNDELVQDTHRTMMRWKSIVFGLDDTCL